MSENDLFDAQFVEQIRRTSSLADIAYKAIREAICYGRVKPGEKLRQMELAEKLDVSQRTVREALNRLTAEGMVIHEPYKGFNVIKLPIEAFEDIYDMRAALEGIAMEHAASKISARDLARMRELLPSAMSQDSESAQLAREVNREFHWIAIRASGRRHLMRVLGQLWELADFGYVFLGESAEQVRLAFAQDDSVEHPRILEALEAHDGTRARKAAIDHVEASLEWLRSTLSRDTNGE